MLVDAWMPRLTGLLLLLGTSLPPSNQQEKNLRLVQVVMRHGDRTPTQYMPTDTANAPETWPQGVGEMTDLGLEQGYRVGQWLKRRYSGFVSSEYLQKEVYARADGGTNRTLMTTQVAMAGFYDPSPEPGELSWYPVPVHSSKGDEDPALSRLPRCPAADYEYIKGELSNETRTFLLRNKDFVDFLSNNSGINIVAALQIAAVYDPIDCEYRHLDTRKPPSWATSAVYDRIRKLGGNALALMYNTVEYQRLRAGPLYKELVDRIRQKASQDWTTLSPDLKFVLYGTHDFNQVALLQALGAFNYHEPPFASALLFELYETDGSFTVEVFYQNSTDNAKPTADLSPPFPLVIAGCPTTGGCPLSTFLRVSKPVLPDDWEAECGLGPSIPLRTQALQTIDLSASKWKNTAFVFIGTTLGLCLVLCLTIVYTVKSNRNLPESQRPILNVKKNGNECYNTI